MKKIIRLTESDLTRIVKRVIRESRYRTVFGDQNYWTDEGGNWVEFDPDLEKTGYYDFEYEPYTEVERFEDIPDDIRERLFGNDKLAKSMYNSYRRGYGNFRYSRMRD